MLVRTDGVHPIPRTVSGVLAHGMVKYSEGCCEWDSTLLPT